MATIYGDNFSSSDGLKKAPGTRHNSAVRRFGNSVDLAVEGGGNTDTLKVADLPAGFVFDEIKISSTANCSGINFTLGTAADPDKYMTTTAGPNATTLGNLGLPAMRQMAALTEGEEVFLTPSGNLPASGTIQVDIYGSKT